MKSAWLIFATVCAVSCSVVVGFDLGPIIWAAQCQSECLKEFTKYHQLKQTSLQDFMECVKYCKMCHRPDGKNTDVCQQDDALERVPQRFRLNRSVQDQPNQGRKIACEYCKARELKSYEPSMLPAPEDKPITMDPHDVAIVFQRQNQREWELLDFYYGRTLVGMVYPCHWVIVVTENGPRHYTWQRWVPNLESLKEGPLVEATVSWRDMNQQLDSQRKLMETRMMHDHRQHLRLSSEKVLMKVMMHVKHNLQRALIEQIFFKKSSCSDRKLGKSFDDLMDSLPKTCRYYFDDDSNIDSSNKSLVVTWGPETGGLTGNQVTDGDSAQISLLPGVKYHVRVASNDGPGSFPIVIDTRHLADHTPPLPPSASACKSTCCVKLFAYTGWQYVVVLFVIAILLYCYIWVDSWLMKKKSEKVQACEKA